MKKLFEHREALTLLARSFVPSLPAVMVEAVKLMAGICLVPPEGHERALEAITTSGELKSISRFQPIIEALSNMENDTLTVSQTGRKPNLDHQSTVTQCYHSRTPHFHIVHISIDENLNIFQRWPASN